MNPDPSSVMLHGLFYKNVSLYPNRKALSSSRKDMTYEELFDYAMSIGRLLRAQGALPNQLVAVVMEKGWEQVVAVLGILQSGAAYLPIDPAFPDARRNFLLKNGKVKFVLTQSWLNDGLKWPEGINRLSIDTITDIEKIEIEYIQQPGDLAYVIYTSGSTGTPKGVMIDHKGAVNTILDINKRFSIDRNDGVFALSNLNFDLSVYDIFGTLAAGATIVLPDHDKIADPAHWKNLILKHQVTIWNSAPALMQALVDYSFMQDINYGDLRLTLLSGDWIPLNLPDKIRTLAKNCRVISLGGATEASIWSILYSVGDVQENWTSIPYGKSMANQSVYVFDDHFSKCEVNVPGELYIGGVGIAKGYWQDPERTKAGFVIHPETGQRLYRTGDIGAYLPDGNIEFLGRKDFQVKIRGYRIELGEIENTIKKFPGVSSAIVQTFENKNRSKKIASYILPASPGEYSFEEHQKSCEKHITEWKEIYEHTYRKNTEKQKSTFNTAGWISSYTGMPIPQPEMSDWLENTVDLIKSLEPETVLEIGCGTGMLLSRIAPFCKHYTGTDVSGQALQHVKTIMGSSNDLNNVALFRKTADDFSELPQGIFDTIIINSVVQYFPDLHYLERVLKKAVQFLKHGGNIFIGDIRNYDLLDVFHSSVQLHKALENQSISELKNKITYNKTREIELTVSPRYFVKLKKEIPEINHLSISPKTGQYINELNCFRYDVVLNIQGVSPQNNMEQVEWLDAEKQSLRMDDIQHVLKNNSSRIVAIRNVVNKRTYKLANMLKFLENYDNRSTVKELKQKLSEITDQGIDPHDLHETAKQFSYHCSLSWGNTGDHGAFDILLEPFSRKKKIGPIRMIVDSHCDEKIKYANDPMHGRFIRRLIPDLKTDLKKRLPEYMQPSFFMLIESIPLNANGKIDRKSLPEPQVLEGENGIHIPPGNTREKALLKIWCRILNVERSGIDDDFFAQGGDSLLAIQFISSVNAELESTLSLQDLLETPTIRELAHKASEGDGRKCAGLPQIKPSPGDRYRPFPLTDIQHAYWMGRHSSFELGNISTHIYFEVEGTDLDVERLNNTWQELIRRHDALKTIISKDGSQKIIEKPPFYQFGVSDMRQYDKAAVQDKLHEIRKKMVNFFPDSDQWPLFDISVSLHKDKIVRIHMVFEVMIIDAWSLFILMKEWRQFYERPDLLLPEPGLTFRDCVLAEAHLKQSPEFLKAKAYWLEKLETLPPCPELPLAVEPSTIEKPVFTRRQFVLAREIWEKLRRQGSQRKITSSVLLLSAFAEILNKWSRRSKFTINITLFNRPPLHPDINNIVGDFTSLTLLAVDNQQNSSFENNAFKLQKQLWNDMDNRHFSGMAVIRELAGKQGTPQKALMPVVFTSLNPDSFGRDFKGLGEMGEVVYTITQTSQVWIDHQVMEAPDGALCLSWDSVDELFPKGLIEDMFRSYCNLLALLADDENAWCRTHLELLPREQYERRVKVNNTEKPLSDQTLHSLFFNQAGKNRDKIAIVSSGFRLSYGDLARYSNHMGRILIEHGAYKNDLIAIVMEKGWEQVAGVLSVLTAGSAYLPIDPAMPHKRLLHILKSGKVKLVLTQSWLKNKIPWPEALYVFSMDTVVPETTYDILLPVQQPVDLAYVMYTSGSTGLPKGVMIDHQGAVNTILDINDRFEIDSDDTVLALSALNFDLSVYDIFGILAAGGTIVIPDEDKLKEPSHWLKLLEEEKISIWNSVPALMGMLIEYNKDNDQKKLQHIKHVLLSGDRIPVILPDQIKQFAHQAEVISLGGATEASIWSILYPIENTDIRTKSIPYGKPMKNQRFYVLNQNMENCPDWVTGELYIGGDGVAKGYWDDSIKTTMQFITHPITNERIYRTGDLGRYLPDGNIEFIGREDFQVKIRGHRIELGEIESVIKKHHTVKDAVVIVTENATGGKKLSGFVVPQTMGINLNGTAYENFYPDGATIKEPMKRMKFKLNKYALRPSLGKSEKIRFNPIPATPACIKDFSLRSSYRTFENRIIKMHQFKNFLASMCAIEVPGTPFPKYRYGSAGGLYPVQVYLYINFNGVEDIPGGLYYHHPIENYLERLNGDKMDETIFKGNETLFSTAGFAIFLIADFKAISPMYGNSSMKFSLIEAGLMSHQLEMSAFENSIGLCQIGHIDFEQIKERFSLHEDHEYLHCLLGGCIEQEKEWTFRDMPKVEHTPKAENKDFIQEINTRISHNLPNYMRPSSLKTLDELPLTLNGKIDRRQLTKLADISCFEPIEMRLPGNDTEEKILEAVKSILNLEHVSTNSNFFEIGANSIHLVKLQTNLMKKFNIDIPIVVFFEHSTIKTLAKHITERNVKEKMGNELDDRRIQNRLRARARQMH